MRCGGCANTIRKALASEFGDVEIDVVTKSITLNIPEGQNKETLGEKLQSLGYPLIDKELGFLDDTTAKMKSIVSCAVGKIS